MATIYEVAELAGVSLATVSRVINDSQKVKANTRQKVLSAMNQLGYRPNTIAQSLASNRSNSVGVLVPELHGPFFGDMLSSIETELREQGKHVIITAGHSDAQKEMESIEFLISRKCDALILLVYAVDHEYLRKLSNGPLPVVLIGQFISEVMNSCITIDDEYGGFLATQCLIELGHTELACITGPLWKSDGQQRFAGFRRALREYGLELNPDLVVEGDYQEVSGRRAMDRLIATEKRFSGLVCGNDEMAAGAIAIARGAGIVVPDELSVVGFDNVFFTRYMHPQLSTIDYPIGKMGQMAARCVLRDVYGEHKFQIQNRFEPSLLRRGSTTTRG